MQHHHATMGGRIHSDYDKEPSNSKCVAMITLFHWTTACVLFRQMHTHCTGEQGDAGETGNL
jgi:hypothetical protein